MIRKRMVSFPVTLAAVLTVVSLLPSGPARAFDDRPAAIGPLSSVFGILGGDSKDDGNIDFRERPALVVPKGSVLPQPRPGAGSRAANWPQDQEVVRRRDEAARARQPQQIELNKNPSLDKRELLSGRNDDQPIAVQLCDNYRSGAPDCERTPMEKIKQVFTLGGASSANDVVIVGKEPDRAYLTEPPKGYRRATQTVKATSERPYERPDDGDARRYYREEAKRNSDYR